MSKTINLSYEELIKRNENLEKQVKDLEGKLVKFKNIDSADIENSQESEQNYSRNLLFLSNTALKFLSFSNDDDIFIFIGKKLAEITHNSIIVVASYSEINNLLSVRFISGINRYLNNILQLLDKNPEDIKIQVTPEFMDVLNLHKQSLHPVPGGLFQATLGQIPENTCQQIERLLKVNHYYAMGLMRGGNLYGAVIIATKVRQNIMNDLKIIETFLFQA